MSLFPADAVPSTANAPAGGEEPVRLKRIPEGVAAVMYCKPPALSTAVESWPLDKEVAFISTSPSNEEAPTTSREFAVVLTCR